MTRKLSLGGLKIDHPLATPNQANYRPPSWPPPLGFPIVIDEQGNVDCVFGESNWNLARWEGKTCNIPFGDGDGKGAKTSKENADLLRQIAGWWLWGPAAVQSASSLKTRVAQIRPVASACSQYNILMSELWRFPAVIDAVAEKTRASDAPLLIGLLHRIYAIRESLGFMILDEGGIQRLAAKIPNHIRVQTAYIPPRIWTYQLTQLRSFLDDYLSYKENISECFNFCLEAYKNNAGSWEALFARRIDRKSRPFGNTQSKAANQNNLKFYGL